MEWAGYVSCTQLAGARGQLWQARSMELLTSLETHGRPGRGRGVSGVAR